MAEDLLALVTRDLLEKFGAGSHKPGSGSAAAFQGMISAKLLVTVISLTNDPEHPDRIAKYAGVMPKLLEIQTHIDRVIYPKLEVLFAEDNDQFGKTIRARKARDKEKTDLLLKNRLRRLALNELKESINIPLQIAKLSIELGTMAEYVFDNGFASARGDSQVALSGALASVSGCISIIQLNLTSFGTDDYSWVKKVGIQCQQFRQHYDHLNLIASSKMDSLTDSVQDKLAFYEPFDELISKIKSSPKLTNTDIENFAFELQELLSANSIRIFGDREDDPFLTLNPELVFRNLLGYHYDNSSDLELNYVEGVGAFEIAGIIDQENKLVQISTHQSVQAQNFTAAHELAHALLHNHAVLHRDRPLDGTVRTKDRPREEIQADRFASAFLMPSEFVKHVFGELFLTNEFIVDDDTTFMLTGKTTRLELKSLRELSMMLAAAESYRGKPFKSLASYFNVSKEVMAIRLEELGLVKL